MDLPKFVGAKNQLRVRLLTAKISLKRSTTPKSAIVCTCTVPGSLGDEAMIQSTVTALKKRGLTVDLLVMSPDEDWSSVKGWRHLQPFMGTDGDLEPLIRALHNYREFYLIGADVLDGYHDEPTTIRLLWLTWLASLQCKTTIIGFSFNDAPTKHSLTMLRRLPSSVRLFARDQISQQRLASLANVQATLSTDVAFLLDPTLYSLETRPSLDWIAEQKKQKHRVIGLNLSGHSFSDVIDAPGGRDKILDHYKIEIECLIKKGISVFLIPHDVRGENGDLAMLNDIYAQLSTEHKKHAMLLTPPLYASAIKQITGSLDAVISGRMHLAIACLGMGTPVGSVVYQGKFEGLYNHFPGLSDLTITPDQALEPNAIVKLASHLLKNQKKQRAIIAKRLPVIQRMARKNISK